MSLTMVSEDMRDHPKQLKEFECPMCVLSHEGQGNLLGLSDKGQCLLKLACHRHVLAKKC